MLQLSSVPTAFQVLVRSLSPDPKNVHVKASMSSEGPVD